MDANKEYYSCVLASSEWANDIRETELRFFDILGVVLEHGNSALQDGELDKDWQAIN